MPNHKSFCHFGCVKAPGRNDRKWVHIGLILTHLRSLLRGSFHARLNGKNFRGRAQGQSLLKSLFFIFFFLSSSLFARSNVEYSGDILQWALPAATFGVTLIKNDWRGSLQDIATIGTTRGTVWVLKKTIKSTRPRGNCGRSFPSGHTAVCFAAAGFIQKRYGWGYGVPFLAAASYVGFTRLHAKAHWFRDVVAGAAIGWIYSRIFVTPFCPRLSLDLQMTSDSATLCAHCQF